MRSSHPIRNSELRSLLSRFNRGDESAFEELVKRTLPLLRSIAHTQMMGRRRGGMLQTTLLVNEAYLRLLTYPSPFPRCERAFLSFVAVAMRNIARTYRRRQAAAKRGGNVKQIQFDDDSILAATLDESSRNGTYAELDSAMNSLQACFPFQYRVVILRFYLDLSIDETAHVLGAGTATVNRAWSKARGFLRDLCRNNT